MRLSTSHISGLAVVFVMLPVTAFAQSAPPPPAPPPSTTTTTNGTNGGQNGVPTIPQYPQNPSHKPPCQIGDMICAYGGQQGDNDPNNPHS